MPNVGDVTVRLTANTAQFVRAMNTAQQKMAAVGDAMIATGAKMTAALTLPLAVVGKTAIETAGNFQRSMNRVRALSGATAKEFAVLEKQALELGRTTEFTARDAAGAMGFLAQAGADAVSIFASLPQTLQLASSATLDLATSADIVTNIMAGFGIEQERLGDSIDVLVTAFTSANTNLSQLAQALKLVGPVAKGAGLSFNETTAALALMGNAGLQASLAGTGLRQVISKLINPSREAEKALNNLGINALSDTGAIRSLVEIVKQFEKGVAQLGGTANAAADIMTIFGQRAGPSMQVLLTQGSEALQGLINKFEDSGGTAERITRIQMEGYIGALKRLQSSFEGLQISIGTALIPTFERFAGAGTILNQKLTNMDSATRNFVLAITSIAFAIGPVLVALGFLIKFVTPFKLLTAAAFALGGAAILVAANWEDAGEVILGIFDEIGSALKAEFFGMFSEETQKNLEAGVEKFKWASGEVQGAWQEILAQDWEALGKRIQADMKIVGDALSNAFTTAGVALFGEQVRPELNAVVNNFRNAVEEIKGLWMAVLSLQWQELGWRFSQVMWGMWQTATSVMALTFKVVRQGFENMVGDTYKTQLDEVEAAFESMKTNLESIWKALVAGDWDELNRRLSLLWQDMKTAASNAMSIVGGVIKTGILSVIGKEHEAKLDAIVNSFVKAKDSIIEKVGELSSKLGSAIAEEDKQKLIMAFDIVKEEIKAAWQELLAEDWSALGARISKNFTQATDELGRFGSIMQSTATIAKNTFELLTKLVNDVLGLEWGSFWEAFSKKLDQALTLVTRDLESFSTAYSNFVRDVVESDDFTGTLTQRFKDALAGPIEFFNKIIDAINKFLEKWKELTGIGDSISGIIDFFSDEDTTAVENNLNSVGKAIDNLKEKVTDPAIAESFHITAESIEEIAEAGSMFEQVGDDFKKSFSGSGSFAEDEADKINEAFKQSSSVILDQADVIGSAFTEAGSDAIIQAEKIGEAYIHAGERLGDLVDISNRGSTFAGSRKNAKVQFPTRDATEFENQLERITLDLQGINQLGGIMEKSFDIEKLQLDEIWGTHEMGPIINQWTDFRVAVNTIWQLMGDQMNTDTEKSLSELEKKMRDFEIFLYKGSIFPDIREGVTKEWAGMGEDMVVATDKMLGVNQAKLNEFQTFMSNWSKEVVEESDLVPGHYERLAAAIETSNEQMVKSSQELVASFSKLVGSIKNDPFGNLDIELSGNIIVEDIQRVTSETEKALDGFQFVFDTIAGVEVPASLEKAKGKILSGILSMKEAFSTEGDNFKDLTLMEQLKKGIEEMAGSMDLFQPKARGLTDIWKDYSDAMNLVTAQQNALGMSYDPLQDQIQRLVKLSCKCNSLWMMRCEWVKLILPSLNRCK
jgi:TP901 family phage tail tape measure protein